LLETIDEPFHYVSLAIVRFVERGSAMFITTTSNGATNMFSMEIGSKRMTGVAFVGHQTLRAQSPLTRTPANGTLLHQGLCLVNVTFLTGREQKSDQSARTFTTDMDLGAETTTTTP
jgi:hypothetical protein